MEFTEMDIGGEQFNQMVYFIEFLQVVAIHCREVQRLLRNITPQKETLQIFNETLQ